MVDIVTLNPIGFYKIDFGCTFFFSKPIFYLKISLMNEALKPCKIVFYAIIWYKSGEEMRRFGGTINPDVCVFLDDVPIPNDTNSLHCFIR